MFAPSLAVAGISNAARPRLPCDPAQISRFRGVRGDAVVEQLLKTTVEAVVAIGAVKKSALERVIVASTVQEKAIAHPTDSRWRNAVSVPYPASASTQCPGAPWSRSRAICANAIAGTTHCATHCATRSNLALSDHPEPVTK
jgi:hypothetical protein